MSKSLGSTFCNAPGQHLHGEVVTDLIKALEFNRGSSGLEDSKSGSSDLRPNTISRDQGDDSLASTLCVQTALLDLVLGNRSLRGYASAQASKG
jgi:hypothetical protein